MKANKARRPCHQNFHPDIQAKKGVTVTVFQLNFFSIMSIYRFAPIYQKRIWGARHLESVLGRVLTAEGKIGESWELVDRPEADSPLVSPEGEKRTLHDLWKGDRKKIFGKSAPATERFPILVKLLDCAENLSVQVHPSPAVASQLQSEPKTEVWYFLQTEKDALIYAGLKKGVTRAQFEKAIGTPALAGLLHTLKTQAGEAMFLPSGRVHAIGGGNLILEVQQNSDTTYRVDDWNRVDEKGQPRALHVAESLASIKFDDFEPTFAQPHSEKVIECTHFTLRRAFLFPEEYRQWTNDGKSFQYHFLAGGELSLGDVTYKAGEAWLMSADHPPYELKPGPEGAELLTVLWGN
jgi:mannose-6-phosphate isomerase